MQFYDSAGLWNVNATIKDNESASAENTEFNTTVAYLDYIVQSVSSLSFIVSPKINDSEATHSISLANGGNTDYPNISIKGHDVIGSKYGDLIMAEKFSVDNETGKTAGQTYMINDTYVNVLQLTGLNSHGANVSESIYFYLDVPAVRTDTYSSTSSWNIKVATE